VQLDPLDIIARGQDIVLHSCVLDYKPEYLYQIMYWEVYKPAHQRRWGYYTLPILYGDDLVARLDPKLDRTTMMLGIKGFWHEDDAPVKDVDFANALAKRLVRFATFVNAKRINIASIQPNVLRKQVATILRDLFDVISTQ